MRARRWGQAGFFSENCHLPVSQAPLFIKEQTGTPAEITWLSHVAAAWCQAPEEVPLSDCTPVEGVGLRSRPGTARVAFSLVCGTPV